MNKARQHYIRGNALRAEEKDELAIQEYEKALVHDASFWLARKSIEFLKKHIEKKHIAFGSLHESEGNLKQAVQEYKKACEANPSSWRTFKKIGLLYKELEEYDKALAYLEKAIKLSPTNASLYLAVGTVYDLKEEYAEALINYDTALRFSPQNKEILTHKRITHKLQHAMSSGGGTKHSASLYIELASLFLEKGMAAKAIAILKRALKRFPHYQEINFTLGNIYYNANNFKLAYQLYRRALQAPHAIIPPEEIYYNLGLALASLERWKDAMAAWQRCLSLASRSRAGLRAKANLALIQKKKKP